MISVQDARRLEENFLGGVGEAQDAYEQIVANEAWTVLGYDTFTEWWSDRVAPRWMFQRLMHDMFGPRNVDDRDVYFIQAGENGPIKIGVAANPQSRVRELQTGSPATLYLIGVVPRAGFAGELDLHHRFATDWMNGEWFRATPELLAYIAEQALSAWQATNPDQVLP